MFEITFDGWATAIAIVIVVLICVCASAMRRGNTLLQQALIFRTYYDPQHQHQAQRSAGSGATETPPRRPRAWTPRGTPTASSTDPPPSYNDICGPQSAAAAKAAPPPPYSVCDV